MLIKCENCGANLSLFLSFNKATCEQCGANYNVERNSSSTEPFSDDNPNSIKVIREENDNERGLFRSKYNGLNSEYDYSVEGMKDKICFTSAVSYFLKKSYRIKKTTFIDEAQEDVFKKSPYRDNYKTKVWRMSKEDKDKEKELNQKKKEYLTNFFETMEKMDINVNDAIEEKYFSRNTSNKYTYDQHTITIDSFVITPSFFERYFPDVFKRYEELKQHKAVTMISEIFAKDIFSIVNSNIKDNLVIYYEGYEQRMFMWSSYLGISEDVFFSKVGMQSINDPITLTAVKIAVIEKLFEQTSINGKNMFDFPTEIYNYPKCNEEAHQGFVFKYLKSFIIPLQEW